MEFWFNFYKTHFFKFWVSCQHFKIRFHMFTHSEQLKIFYTHNLIKTHWLSYRNFQGAKRMERNTNQKKELTAPPLPPSSSFICSSFPFRLKKHAPYIMSQEARTPSHNLRHKRMCPSWDILSSLYPTAFLKFWL